MLEILKKLTVPAGEGVYTVNTAADKRIGMQKLLYQIEDNSGDKINFSKEVKEKHLENLNKVNSENNFFILGIPSDCGGGILRGANWGPLFLRLNYLADKTQNATCDYHSPFIDLGDIRVVPHLLSDSLLNSETIKNVRKALYGDQNVDLPCSPLDIAHKTIETIYQLNNRAKIFSLGGDHSVSYPIIKAYSQLKKRQNKKIALIHFDAHTDLLESRLGIDICFGSWTYHILKEELQDPQQLIQIGIRSSGKDKEHWEKKFGITQYWNHDVFSLGPEKIASNIINKLKNLAVEEVYITFDIDAIDEKYASATGTPETDGLRPHECVSIIKLINNVFPITGADLVEVAPFTVPNSLILDSTASTLLTSKRIMQCLMDCLLVY